MADTVTTAATTGSVDMNDEQCSTTTIVLVALLSTAVAYWLMTMPCSAADDDEEVEANIQHEYMRPAEAVEDEVLSTPFGPKCTKFIFDDAVEVAEVESSATERVKDSFLFSKINRMLQKSL